MTTTTTNTPEGWSPSVVSRYNPDDMLSDALIIRAATFAGAVDGDEPAVLVPYVATDPEAGFVAEGQPIDNSDTGSAQVVITTNKVAVVTRMSRELTNHPSAAERIAGSVRRSVIAKADAAFLGNNEDPTGLFNIDGINTAGNLGTDLFAAYDAVAAIEADGGQATHVLIHPTDWGALSKLPVADGSNQSLLANVHDAATRSLAGVPVIVHSAVPAGEAMVLDRSEVVGAYGQLQLMRSDDAFFTYDSVAIRATFRLGWRVIRPARLAKLTIGDSENGAAAATTKAKTKG